MPREQKREVWKIFAPHHYLNDELNYASDCWVLKWNNTLVGFCAVLTQPTGSANYCKRVSRLVILPDFQGIGAGTRFLDAICKMYVDCGYKMYIRSAHMKLANYWHKTPTWKPTSKNERKSCFNNGEIRNKNPYIVNRVCYSYEYMGTDFASKPHMEIVVDSLANINMAEMRKMLVKLKRQNYITVIHNRVKSESKLNLLCKELGIRTELLYVNGELNKKHIGDKKLVSLKSGCKPVYKEVA